MKRSILFGSAAVGLLAVSLLGAAEALACMPMGESVLWSVPDEGGEILGEGPLYAVVMGFPYSNDGPTIVLKDGAGEPVAFEDDLVGMARLQQSLRTITPEEPLAVGEYTLSITYDAGDGAPSPPGFEVQFEVVDALPAFDISQTVGLQWFQETYDEGRGDSCQYDDLYNMIALDGLDEEPAFYELRIISEDGVDVPLLLRPEEADGAARGLLVRDIECIQAWAVMADGEVTEVTEVCKPDRCVHYAAGEGPFSLGGTDWSEVDGCGDEDDEGDEDVEDDEGDEDIEDDEGDEDVEDDEGDEDVEDDEGDEDIEDDEKLTDSVEGGGCGGCASSPNPADPLLTGVLALFGIALIRRRWRRA